MFYKYGHKSCTYQHNLPNQARFNNKHRYSSLFRFSNEYKKRIQTICNPKNVNVEINNILYIFGNDGQASFASDLN